MIEILELFLTAIAIGVSSAVVLGADPVKWVLKLLRLDQFKLFKCFLCFGFWYSLSLLSLLGIELIYAFIFAGVGAYTSEKIHRKLLEL